MRFLSTQKGKIQSLKHLAEEHLGLKIQNTIDAAENAAQSEVNGNQSQQAQEEGAADDDGNHHSSLEDAFATMKLFLKFKDHPEGIYSDSTIQTFNFRKESEMLMLKRQKKLKRRDKKAAGKKVHRKELEKKM